MSNYLSRLARASGLDYGLRPTSRAGSAAHTTRGETAAAPREPPHSELVVFDEHPQPARLLDEPGERADDHLSHADREHAQTEEAASREEDSAVRLASEAWGVSPAPERVKQSFLPGADERHESLHGKGRVRLDVPRETGARLEGSLRAEDAAASTGSDLAAQGGGRDSSRGQTFASKDEAVFVSARERPDIESVVELLTNTSEAGAGDVESPVAAEARRAYMREIVEWISAPSAARAEDLEEARATEQRAAARVREQPSVRVAEEASGGLAVDELTLSIGSIHVVVEEPQGQPPARPEAPASAARASDAFEGEGSSLRRHYIRV